MGLPKYQAAPLLLHAQTSKHQTLETRCHEYLCQYHCRIPPFTFDSRWIIILALCVIQATDRDFLSSCFNNVPKFSFQHFAIRSGNTLPTQPLSDQQTQLSKAMLYRAMQYFYAVPLIAKCVGHPLIISHRIINLAFCKTTALLRGNYVEGE